MLTRLRDLLRPSPPLYQQIRSAADGYAREAEKDRVIQSLSNAVMELRAVEALHSRQIEEREAEIESALYMGGAGPWAMPGEAKGEYATRETRLAKLSESIGPGFSAQGAYGDIELALQNIEWRREINLSWLEFSRWGIQQIILISRLYYIKNPLIQRGCNVSSQYVFGRGVDVTTTDPSANEVLERFFERNKRTLGQIALAELERRKYYDGNIFFALFTDTADTGEVDIRTIDATEIQEIVTDPDDSDRPWYYRREWIHKGFDPATGEESREWKKAYYPALGFEPRQQVKEINGIPVMWDTPVLHRRCGAIGKWHFGCPLVYAALAYAKTSVEFLEACMTIRQSLAQFSMMLTTKGGQQALAGAKQQLSTTVGPSASLWDQNPTAVPGSIFAAGPGTTLAAFNQKSGSDPAEVREYKLQVAMVFGIPESFLADMKTSKLATATSLDRPTELNFLSKQEEWREDLTTIAAWVLSKSLRAPSGKLREALAERYKRLIESPQVQIMEAPRSRDGHGRTKYKPNAKENQVQIMVNFPTIIEADTPAMVNAVVASMTLGNTQGEVVGIDEKEGVRQLYELVGTENSEELLEEQYPAKGKDAYDPLRGQDEEDPLPVPGAPPAPGAPQPKPNGKATTQ